MLTHISTEQYYSNCTDNFPKQRQYKIRHFLPSPLFGEEMAMNFILSSLLKGTILFSLLDPARIS